MTSSNELPPLPRWAIAKESRTAQALYHNVLSRWEGGRMTEQTVAMLVDDVSEYFKLKQYAQYIALVDTFCQDIDAPLTKKLLRRIAMQLVANASNLEDGKGLRRFEGVNKPEWVPFTIIKMESSPFGNRAGVLLHLIVLAGPYAGYDAQKKVPMGFLARLAYDIGFNTKWAYEEPQELLDMQFAGFLTPSSDAELQFEDYQVSGAMRKHNLALIRFRREDEDDNE